jgi:predicted NodU family carbamoyl transferase
MEFGPRALGSRSIIADPRSEKMQKNLCLSNLLSIIDSRRNYNRNSKLFLMTDRA